VGSRYRYGTPYLHGKSQCAASHTGSGRPRRSVRRGAAGRRDPSPRQHPAPLHPASRRRARATAATLSLRDAVDQILIADGNRTGYNRNEFGSGWTDAGHDGCNTRAEVLIEEVVTPPTVTGRCTITAGTGT
jgi:hypothetical protein